MDMDTRPPPHRSFPENEQPRVEATLMRYHSAPSSVLSTLIHSEDFFCESIAHVDNSELARLLSPVDDDESCTSVSRPYAAPANTDVQCAIDAPSTQTEFSMEPGALDGFRANAMPTHQPFARCSESKATAGDLSSIFEHNPDDQCADFRISASPTVHDVHADNYRNPEFSLPESTTPTSTSSFRQSLLRTTKSNLIRHSSFPANFNSSCALEGCRTADISGPRMRNAVENRLPDNIRGSHMQIMAKSKPQENIRVPHGNVQAMHLSHDNKRGAHFPLPGSFKGAGNPFKIENEAKVGDNRGLESPLSINQSSLFQQSSCASALLSQSSFEGTVSGCEKELLSPSSRSSSEDDRRGKESRYLSRMSGFWEDEGGLGAVAFGRRKRERETEDKIVNGLQQQCPAEEETLQWSSGGCMDTSLGGVLSMDESVLCRARAKRGCATHPRSIAERVRRTKISDGMRKLQELVPNMEKQTNTVTMLNEAVEYVKFLQQQVQKLSENQAKCNGMSQSEGNT